EIVVVSGHVAPDDPRSLVDWSALARLRGTLVLLMAVERIGAVAQAVIAGGRPADTPAAGGPGGTTRRQRGPRASPATLADEARDQGINPPAVIAIGPVAGLADGAVTANG